MSIENEENAADKIRYIRALQNYCKILIANAKDIVGNMNGLSAIDITIHIPCLNDETDAPNVSVNKTYHDFNTIYAWISGEEVQNE